MKLQYSLSQMLTSMVAETEKTCNTAYFVTFQTVAYNFAFFFFQNFVSNDMKYKHAAHLGLLTFPSTVNLLFNYIH